MHTSRSFVAPAVLSLALALPAQFVEPGVTVLASTPGFHAGDLFGWCVRPLNDVDADGFADFAVAAPFFNLNIGRVSVHSGKDCTLLWSRDGAATSSIMGFDLATIRDVDADGKREVVVSAPFSTGSPGYVYVYSGAAGALLKQLAGPAAGSNFGYGVATGGDFDGDGIEDIAIGATNDSTLSASAGRVWVYSTNGFSLIATVDAPAGDVNFGTALAFVGDLNADGRDDLVVGARNTTTGPTGRLYLVARVGTTNTFLRTIQGADFGYGTFGNKARGGGDLDGDGVPDVWLGEGTINQARAFSGATGALLFAVTDVANDRLGTGGAGIVRDLNGDGVPDLLVGATGNSAGATSGGRVLVLSGRDRRRLATLTHTLANTGLGGDVQLLPDRNADGAPELLVAARGSGGTVQTFGAVYVIAGTPALAGWRSYGAGLAGTTGVPALALAADPVLGTQVSLEVANSLGAATPAALVVGTSAASLATPWGGTLLVTPLVALSLVLPAGGAALPLAVPGDASALGAAVHFQSFVADAGAKGLVAESRGLRAVAGR